MNIFNSIQYIFLFTVLFIGCTGTPPPGKPESIQVSRSNINTLDLIYTNHAKCRMDCREVSRNEVVEIIVGNKINVKKSDYNNRPCPTLAYEGRSSDGQLLRVVVADCEPKDKVVTVIDLETDFKCNCY